MDILRELRSLPGVKKVFIRSGIRYDYLMADRASGQEFLHELCEHHVSGTLKVAPEHISDNVLRRMHKPPRHVFEKFWAAYEQENKRIGKKQYLIPYFISSHPGSTLEDACELSVFLKKHGFVPDQVQDFYPTPATLSTCMYYTGYDPVAKESVYVARDPEEKHMQRAMLHFNKPENAELVRRALRLIGRKDLIGQGPEALVRPGGPRGSENGAKGGRSGGDGDRGRGPGRGGAASAGGRSDDRGGKNRKNGGRVNAENSIRNRNDKSNKNSNGRKNKR